MFLEHHVWVRAQKKNIDASWQIVCVEFDATDGMWLASREWSSVSLLVNNKTVSSKHVKKSFLLTLISYGLYKMPMFFAHFLIWRINQSSVNKKFPKWSSIGL